MPGLCLFALLLPQPGEAQRRPQLPGFGLLVAGNDQSLLEARFGLDGVWKSAARYEPTAKFTSWLFRIATHVALNWLRDRRHEANQLSLSANFERDTDRQIPDRRPTVDQLLLHDVKLEEVRRAIAELPDRQRAAVIMHKYEELEYTQIAAALNCSPQTVKSLLFRAYNTLRVRLAHLAG